MKTKMDLKCPVCGVKACYTGLDKNTPPDYCPMTTEPELLETILQSCLDDPELLKLTQESARTESGGYCKKTRVEEIMDFARRIGAKKLGIAHCIGLIQEARMARKIFLANDFEVAAVCCKVGAVEKTEMGLKEEDKIRPGGHESMCNPIAQAALLAEAGAQLNVLIGLCVGHDSLFFMHTKAPATVLVAKDRVTGHNPAAALYTSHSYYRRLAGE